MHDPSSHPKRSYCIPIGPLGVTPDRLSPQFFKLSAGWQVGTLTGSIWFVHTVNVLTLSGAADMMGGDPGGGLKSTEMVKNSGP